MLHATGYGVKPAHLFVINPTGTKSGLRWRCTERNVCVPMTNCDGMMPDDFMLHTSLLRMPYLHPLATDEVALLA